IVSPEPAELAAGIDRFEIVVAAGETADLAVTYRRTDLTRLAVASYDLGRLIGHQRSGAASAEVVAAVRRAAELQAAVTGIERQLQQLENEREEIVRDQSRLRDNLGRVGANTELGGRYIRQLTDQEDRLEAIARAVGEARAELERARRRLEEYIGSLNVR
ncbi:MAG: hypothetical protein ACYTEV_01980, partial [Planctomycetota bacterium]